MKHLLFICIALLFSFSIYAQDNVAADRKVFFAEQINFTPAESKAFWPVYDQYLTELQILRLDRKKAIAEARLNSANLTDKQIELLVNNRIVLKQHEVDIEKRYCEKFKQLLPIQKVAKVYLAQEAFKRRMVKKLSDTQ